MITTSSTSRLQLSKFPLYELNPENLKETLATSAYWVLPQVSALLGRILIPKKVNDLYSFKATVQDLVRRQPNLTFDCGKPITLDDIKGIFVIVKSAPRGAVLGTLKQNGDGIRYAANVPLALAAVKQYRSINYAEWDWTEPERGMLLDRDNDDAANHFNVNHSFTNTDLLQFRVNSTLVKSGAKAGTHRTLAGTTNILKSGVSEFDELPKLTRLMLCQTWIYQPSNYHNLMITNHLDLDNPAEPLVPGEVISTKVVKTKKVYSTMEIDWAD